jgi:hypothetical protein
MNTNRYVKHSDLHESEDDLSMNSKQSESEQSEYFYDSNFCIQNEFESMVRYFEFEIK